MVQKERSLGLAIVDRNLIASQFEAIHESCDLKVSLIVDLNNKYPHLVLSNLFDALLQSSSPFISRFSLPVYH